MIDRWRLEGINDLHARRAGAGKEAAKRAVEQAAARVSTYLAEFNTLGGLDRTTIHIANRTPLLADDVWTLVRAVLKEDI